MKLLIFGDMFVSSLLTYFLIFHYSNLFFFFSGPGSSDNVVNPSCDVTADNSSDGRSEPGAENADKSSSERSGPIVKQRTFKGPVADSVIDQFSTKQYAKRK